VPEIFEAWVEAMRTPVEPVRPEAIEGHDIFMRSTCIACHSITGTRAQGRLGPDLTLMGERFSIGAGLLANTEENMTEWILRAPELKKGIVMPGARVEAGGMPPTGLTRDEARAVAAYLAELRLPPAELELEEPTAAAPAGR
jgi:cytochrome c oxidase subunit II